MGRFREGPPGDLFVAEAPLLGLAGEALLRLPAALITAVMTSTYPQKEQTEDD